MALWEDRTKAALCRLLFKHKYNEEYLIIGRDTRLQEGPVFKMDTPKSDWFARCTAYIGRQTWNALPAQIRRLDDLNCFKRAVKRHFSESRLNGNANENSIHNIQNIPQTDQSSTGNPGTVARVVDN